MAGAYNWQFSWSWHSLTDNPACTLRVQHVTTVMSTKQNDPALQCHKSTGVAMLECMLCALMWQGLRLAKIMVSAFPPSQFCLIPHYAVYVGWCKARM